MAMKKCMLALAVLALIVGGVGHAWATPPPVGDSFSPFRGGCYTGDPDFVFDNGQGLSGSFSVNVTGGVADSGYLDVTNAPDSGTVGHYTLLLAGGPNTTYQSTYQLWVSPSGAFWFDNIVDWPSGDQGYVDSVGGLVFINGDGRQINIWGSGAKNNGYSLYSWYQNGGLAPPAQWDQNYHYTVMSNNNVTVTAVDKLGGAPAVPEASSLLLLVPGLVPLGLILRKQSKT